jgi:hypothetical protein
MRPGNSRTWLPAMCANNSLDKSRQELRDRGKTDLDGLVDYTFDLQAKVRLMQDAAAQNSRNSWRGCGPFAGVREATRKQRLATAIEWMAQGKPRHWKYMKY